MIGQLGELEIASVALANQLYFLLMLFLFGVSSGGAIFAAQFWGKKDIKGLRRTQGLMLATGLSGAVFFVILVLTIPKSILGLFTTDQAVIETGTGYLSIIAPSYVFTAVSVIFSAVLRSTGKVKIPLLATGLSTGLNTVGNCNCIFGKLVRKKAATQS